jgi:hypothetical protein
MVFLGFRAHAGGQKTILQFTQELLVGRKLALVHSPHASTSLCRFLETARTDYVPSGSRGQAKPEIVRRHRITPPCDRLIHPMNPIWPSPFDHGRELTCCVARRSNRAILSVPFHKVPPPKESMKEFVENRGLKRAYWLRRVTL